MMGAAFREPPQGAAFPLDGGFAVRSHLAHLVVTLGDLTLQDAVLVRIHRECLAGDLFASSSCGCRRNMRAALARIGDAGAGVLVYVRGGGNCSARADLRDSGEIVAAILTELGVHKAHLLVDDDVPMLPGVEIGELRPLLPGAPAGLTTREVEVLKLIAGGLVTKQIAERLAISRRTAYHHVEHIYAKIGTSTRAAAAAFAVEHGIAHPV
jgi:DNA-binding CsgD family transcriptional regulator